MCAGMGGPSRSRKQGAARTPGMSRNHTVRKDWAPLCGANYLKNVLKNVFKDFK